MVPFEVLVKIVCRSELMGCLQWDEPRQCGQGIYGRLIIILRASSIVSMIIDQDSILSSLARAVLTETISIQNLDCFERLNRNGTFRLVIVFFRAPR